MRWINSWSVSIALACVTLASAALCLPARGQLAEVKGGAWIEAGAYADFHVVLPEAPSEALEAAARAFSVYWEQSTGHKTGISTVNEGMLNAWIGSDAASAAGLLPARLMEELAPDQLYVRTYVPPSRYRNKGAMRQLILAGGSDRAALYSVYHFFQQALKTRWIAPGVVVTPRARWAMEMIDYSGRPPFDHSEIDLHQLWREQEGIDEFRRAHKLPDIAAASFPRASTLADWLGVKAACPQEERSLQALLNAIDRELQQPTGRLRMEDEKTVVNVSLVHDAQPCSCATCAAAGGATGALLQLLAGLADARPELRIESLLEGAFAAVPENARPHTDLVIALSTRGCDALRALDDGSSARNSRFLEELRAWTQLAGHVHVWESANNLRNPLAPHPNFAFLRENLQLYTQHGVKGVFVRGLPSAGIGVAEFDALRAYLFAMLLWDPGYSGTQGVEEFLSAYYGAAAPHIAEYMRLTDRHAREQGIELHADAGPWWNEAWIEQARALFQQALGEELDESTRLRVERAQLPVHYAAMATGAPSAMPLDEFEQALRRHTASPEALLSLVKADMPEKTE